MRSFWRSLAARAGRVLAALRRRFLAPRLDTVAALATGGMLGLCVLYSVSALVCLLAAAYLEATVFGLAALFWGWTGVQTGHALATVAGLEVENTALRLETVPSGNGHPVVAPAIS